MFAAAASSDEYEELKIFEKYLKDIIGDVPFDYQTFGAYFLSILKDEDVQNDEKIESIEEMLAAANIGESLPINSYAASIVAKYEELSTKQNDDAEPTGSAASLFDKLSASRMQSKRPQISSKGDDRKQTPMLPNVDHSIKQRLVDQFGYQMVDVVKFDDEGRMIDTPKLKEANEAPISDFRNDNREKVIRKAQLERVNLKEQRQNELEMKQKQKQQLMEKKEKEKMRVAKKERRSGR